MEPNVNYTAVGAFVIALLAAIIVTIIWLSVGLTRTSYTPYLVYMNESVTGLNPDAPVRFNGVIVGAVKSLELNAKDPQQVKLLLNIKTGTPITEDTTAMLDTVGLTGVAYIDLQSKGISNKPLQAPPDEPYPIIPTKPSIFLRLDTALSQLSQQLQVFLSADNQREFKQTLINLNQATANAAKASQQLPIVLQAFEGQTLPIINQAVNNLNSVTNNLVDISNEVKQNPSVLIRGKAPQALGPGEQ
jgi:phospholipid/cholesterol/gamma-HCH transport system substrate-binding protein